MTDPLATPSPLLLDPAETAEHLLPFRSELAALDSLLADGTHVIPAMLPKEGAKFSQLTVLGVFGRQALAMADAASLLLRSGAVHAARVVNRSLFEASVFIEWIDSKDSERRARAFYVWNIRRQLRWLARATPGTEERKEMEAAVLNSGLAPTTLPTLSLDELSKEKDKVTKLLRNPKYRGLNAEFDQRRRSRPYDPEWYSILFGPKNRPSLKGIAKDVGRHMEYVHIYESGSEVTHGNLFDIHLHVRPGTVYLWPLRELRAFPEVIKSTITLLLALYTHLLKTHDPSRLPDFTARYIQEWRSATISNRSVSYNLPV